MKFGGWVGALGGIGGGPQAQSKPSVFFTSIILTLFL